MELTCAAQCKLLPLVSGGNAGFSACRSRNVAGSNCGNVRVSSRGLWGRCCLACTSPAASIPVNTHYPLHRTAAQRTSKHTEPPPSPPDTTPRDRTSLPRTLKPTIHTSATAAPPSLAETTSSSSAVAASSAAVAAVPPERSFLPPMGRSIHNTVTANAPSADVTTDRSLLLQQQLSSRGGKPPVDLATGSSPADATSDWQLHRRHAAGSVSGVSAGIAARVHTHVLPTANSRVVLTAAQEAAAANIRKWYNLLQVRITGTA